MMDTPEQVLARWETDAAALRRRGFAAEGDRVADMAKEMRAALSPLALVPEHTATVRSGKSVRFLRDRHAEWCRTGAAGFDLAGDRMYRLCVLPTRLARAQGVAEANRLLESMEADDAA